MTIPMSITTALLPRRDMRAQRTKHPVTLTLTLSL